MRMWDVKLRSHFYDAGAKGKFSGGADISSFEEVQEGKGMFSIFCLVLKIFFPVTPIESPLCFLSEWTKTWFYILWGSRWHIRRYSWFILLHSSWLKYPQKKFRQHISAIWIVVLLSSCKKTFSCCNWWPCLRWRTRGCNGMPFYIYWFIILQLISSDDLKFLLCQACHARISTPTAQLSLPELQLGLIPGFGGMSVGSLHFFCFECLLFL